MFRCSVPEVYPGEVLEVAETGTSYRILRLIGESSSWRNYRRPMQIALCCIAAGTSWEI
jgi:hypothetical protein